MTGRGFGILIVLLIGLFGAGMAASTAVAADTQRISADKLITILDDPNVVIIDVRVEGDWKGSTKKIQGAEREDPTDVESWMDDYSKDKTIVLYCA
jgi:rhodanese-related sulfurtransferase